MKKMSDEYIRKKDAINALNERAGEYPRWVERYDQQRAGVITARDIIDDLPSADVAPVVHSRWIKTEDGAECEICGREAVYQIVDDHWEYEPWCPHCGAKMDGKE